MEVDNRNPCAVVINSLTDCLSGECGILRPSSNCVSLAASLGKAHNVFHLKEVLH
jgi:hypothetical protein